MKIISLVPSLTELLVDLGLEKNIVGITKFCVHPKHLKKEKTIVGGTKQVNIDKIKELKPDIILCNKEENTKEIVDSCKEIAPTNVSDIFSIKDTIKLIKFYGDIFSKEKKAIEIINKINFLLVDFKEFISEKKFKKIVYFIWKKPWMVAANNTFINHLLELNNFDNIFKSKERYPEVSLNELKGVDFIFLSSEPYPFKEKHILELEKATNTKAILVDGEMFSWYGSRLVKSFSYFKKLHKKLEKINN